MKIYEYKTRSAKERASALVAEMTFEEKITQLQNHAAPIPRLNVPHYEYWNDYNPKTKQIENVEMPIRYVIEMFCDRVAASKIYNGENYKDSDPFTYFLRIRGKHRMHPNTEALLEKLLVMLRDEGEEKTFAYIKTLKKK